MQSDNPAHRQGQPPKVVNAAGETEKAGCLVVKDGKILLVTASHKTIWGLPKGHAEGDEAPEAVAKRETLEETGFNVVIERYVGDMTYVGKTTNEPIRVHYFLASPGDWVGPAEEQWQWFEIAEALTMIPDNTAAFIRHHLGLGTPKLPSGHERAYQQERHVWGAEPHDLITRAQPLMRPGRVLDLGAGDGRNALYLAACGHPVTAVDVATTGLAHLSADAKSQGIEAMITPVVADIARYQPSDSYEAVISTFTLHFVARADFSRVLTMMQTATVPGGLNVIADFTTDGPLYDPASPTYWPESGELRARYEAAGWHILYDAQYPARTRARDANGEPYVHTAATLIARKPGAPS